MYGHRSYVTVGRAGTRLFIPSQFARFRYFPKFRCKFWRNDQKLQVCLSRFPSETGRRRASVKHMAGNPTGLCYPYTSYLNWAEICLDVPASTVCRGKSYMTSGKRLACWLRDTPNFTAVLLCLEHPRYCTVPCYTSTIIPTDTCDGRVLSPRQREGTLRNSPRRKALYWSLLQPRGITEEKFG